MGSSIGAPLGYSWAAYHRSIELYSGEPGGYGFPPFSKVFATDMNCYNYGFGLADGGRQSVSLTQQSLGYRFLQYDGGPTSYLSPAPGHTDWQNYLYYGGLGFAGSNGVFDFCCSTAAQNGVADDKQCAASQSTTVCP
jgi:hypothetical protein